MDGDRNGVLKMPRLAVVRDKYLNPWDCSNYYGVVQHGIELLLCGSTIGPDWDTIGCVCPKAQLVKYDNPWEVLECEPDVVDVPDPFYDFAGYFSVRFPRTVVVGWETLPGKAMVSRSAAKCISSAWKFVARSNLAASVLKLDGANPDKVTVIPAAVNTDIFSPGPEMGDRERAVLFVGRDVPEKGLADLICAMAGIDAVLWVVGQTGDDWCRKLADRYGVYVNWMGKVRWLDLPRIYQTAMLFCLPSVPVITRTDPYGNWTEQFGQVLAESMACGTPVVATSCGAIPEVLGSWASIVPPRDWRGLSLAIRQALTYQFWRHDQIRGQRMVHDHYEQSVVGVRIAEWYFG